MAATLKDLYTDEEYARHNDIRLALTIDPATEVRTLSVHHLKQIGLLVMGKGLVDDLGLMKASNFVHIEALRILSERSLQKNIPLF